MPRQQRDVWRAGRRAAVKQAHAHLRRSPRPGPCSVRARASGMPEWRSSSERRERSAIPDGQFCTTLHCGTIATLLHGCCTHASSLLESPMPRDVLLSRAAPTKGRAAPQLLAVMCSACASASLKSSRFSRAAQGRAHGAHAVRARESQGQVADHGEAGGEEKVQCSRRALLAGGGQIDHARSP